MWKNQSLLMNELARSREFPENFYIFGDISIIEDDMLKPKIHTLREDKKNRWRVDTNIHFIINNRTINRFQFAPTLPVTCIQDVKIRFIPVFANKGCISITVDNRELSTDECTQFIENDGFDTIDDFINWFFPVREEKLLNLRLIHWTNFRY
jgi:hypothetical protein